MKIELDTKSHHVEVYFDTLESFLSSSKTCQLTLFKKIIKENVYTTPIQTLEKEYNNLKNVLIESTATQANFIINRYENEQISLVIKYDKYVNLLNIEIEKSKAVNTNQLSSYICKIVDIIKPTFISIKFKDSKKMKNYLRDNLKHPVLFEGGY